MTQFLSVPLGVWVVVALYGLFAWMVVIRVKRKRSKPGQPTGGRLKLGPPRKRSD